MLAQQDCSSGSTPEAAKHAAFDRARLRWRTLGADRGRWVDPERQRELAAAFLRYHAAKLDLEATALTSA